MAIDLDGYNPVAQSLLEAFDESEISEREGNGGKSFSYVPPERYRYRLLRVFPQGYTFHISDLNEGKAGVRATAHFIGEAADEGVRYDIKVAVFEPWSKTQNGEFYSLDQTYAKLNSAGLKGSAREMGLGLHLYDKTAKKTGASKPSAAKKPNPKKDEDLGDYAEFFDEEWDGSDALKITKHKGTPYNELDDGLLSWLINKVDQNEKPNPDKGALKEMARRMAEGGGEATKRAKASTASKSPKASDDDEFPF